MTSKAVPATVAAVSLFAQIASAETLVTPPYPSKSAWRLITDRGNAQAHIREWIPADQSESNILDILTEQKFFTVKNGDPSAMIASIAQGAQSACDSLRVNGPKRASENGYPVAYGQIYCGHQKDTPFDVTIFIKAIGGHDALYVVQREFHRPTQGGPAGVVSFDRPEDAKALLAEQAAADKYLASSVKLNAK